MAALFGNRRMSPIAGGGRVSAALGSFLNSHQPGGPTTRSAAEWVADIVARTTGLNIERSAHRKTRRNRNRLTRAVGSYQRHTAALDRFTTETRVRERELRERTYGEHRATDLRTRSNPAVTLISGPFLLLVETIVLIAELTFYYYMFSSDLQADAGWLEQAMIIVLALLVPVAGIAAARWFGASFTTVRGLHAGAVETRTVLAYLALMTATATLAVVCSATFELVVWRYAGQTIPGLTVSHPPERVMATVFVVVLLLDAGIRAFAVPVAARSDAHLAHSIRSDRRAHARLVNAQSKALTKWITAWTALETVLYVLLDDIERSLSAADVHVLAARARVAGQSDEHDADSALRPAHDAGWEGIRIGPRMALPHIDVQLRILDAAFAQLHAQTPPAYVHSEPTVASLQRRIDLSRKLRHDGPDEAVSVA
ncbi:hypothetical protein [Nocardia farcinica]|uniref:hypothetical protein n=1 Tax=Nocardia farcinica TaxID=37329 RepID=UPI002458F8CE|nr:hypothetical protein [Nocardia farcinica]